MSQIPLAEEIRFKISGSPDLTGFPVVQGSDVDSRLLP